MGRVCHLCKRRFQTGSSRSYHLFPKADPERSQWFQILNMEVVHKQYLYLCSDHFSPMDFYMRLNGKRVLKKRTVPLNASSEGASASAECDKASTVTSSTVSSSVTTDESETESEEKPCLPLPVPLSSSTTTADWEHVDIKTEVLSMEDDQDESSVIGPLTNEWVQASQIQEVKHEASDTSSHQSTSDLISTTRVETLTYPQQKRCLNPRYMNECVIDETTTPAEAKRNWHIAKYTVQKQKKKISALQQQNRRLKARVAYLELQVKHLTKISLKNEQK